jgi:hypothetical protein
LIGTRTCFDEGLAALLRPDGNPVGDGTAQNLRHSIGVFGGVELQRVLGRGFDVLESWNAVCLLCSFSFGYCPEIYTILENAFLYSASWVGVGALSIEFIILIRTNVFAAI